MKKTVALFVSLILMICWFSISYSESWDNSIPLTSMSSKETVTDDEILTIALSSIKQLKEISKDPFSIKIQDVKYYTSTKEDFKDYAFFLVAHSIGNSPTESSAIFYDKSNDKICIFSFGTLIYSPDSIEQNNNFAACLLNLRYKPSMRNIVLNQNGLSKDNVADLLNEIGQLWQIYR